MLAFPTLKFVQGLSSAGYGACAFVVGIFGGFGLGLFVAKIGAGLLRLFVANIGGCVCGVVQCVCVWWLVVIW